MSDRALEAAFIPGLELSRRFFHAIVEPLLADNFPKLRYAAGLIGDGSEVLGFDTPLSADHDWGARCQIFLSQQDCHLQNSIFAVLLEKLPKTFLGHPITFAGENYKRGMDVTTVEAFFSGLGFPFNPEIPLTIIQWLGCSQQFLLGYTSGAVFRDDLGTLSKTRKQLDHYPADVRQYVLAAYWQRIAQEQAFVGRCISVGDKIGSKVILLKLVGDMLRMVLLLQGRYAPYNKWLGTAVSKSGYAPILQGRLENLLTASTWEATEDAFCESLLELANLQCQVDGLEIKPVISLYHDRPFRVINADDFVFALLKKIENPAIAALPLIGNIDQLSDNTDVLCNPVLSQRVIENMLG